MATDIGRDYLEALGCFLTITNKMTFRSCAGLYEECSSTVDFIDEISSYEAIESDCPSVIETT